jgi:hypothetical protein
MVRTSEAGVKQRRFSRRLLHSSMLQPVNRCIHFIVPVAVLLIAPERSRDTADARSNPDHVVPQETAIPGDILANRKPPGCLGATFPPPLARLEGRITHLTAHADA